MFDAVAIAKNCAKGALDDLEVTLKEFDRIFQELISAAEKQRPYEEILALVLQGRSSINALPGIAKRLRDSFDEFCRILEQPITNTDTVRHWRRRRARGAVAYATWHRVCLPTRRTPRRQRRQALPVTLTSAHIDMWSGAQFIRRKFRTHLEFFFLPLLQTVPICSNLQSLSVFACSVFNTESNPVCLLCVCIKIQKLISFYDILRYFLLRSLYTYVWVSIRTIRNKSTNYENFFYNLI